MIPTVYSPAPPTAAANYDFTDLISREGYSDFYGVHLSGQTVLSRKAVASVTRVQAYGGSVTDTIVESINWTYTVQAPLVMQGDLLLARSYEWKSISSTVGIRSDVVLSVNSTRVAQLSGNTVLLAGTVTGSHRDTLKLAVPATKINPGDTITVNTKTWKDGNYTLLCHYDGASRGTTGLDSGYGGNQIDILNPGSTIAFKNSTDLTVSIPFKVRLG